MTKADHLNRSDPRKIHWTPTLSPGKPRIAESAEWEIGGENPRILKWSFWQKPSYLLRFSTK